MPTVKAPRNFSIDEQIAALRLQAMAGETAKRFGRRMRQRRVELDLTQKQVAARFEPGAVDGQRISDWERGYNEPSDRYKTEIVKALEVPDVSYFFEEPERPTGESPLDGFGGGNGIGSQLDRIEQKLDRILLRLGEPPAVEGPPESDLRRRLETGSPTASEPVRQDRPAKSARRRSAP